MCLLLPPGSGGHSPFCLQDQAGAPGPRDTVSLRDASTITAFRGARLSRPQRGPLTPLRPRPRSNAPRPLSWVQPSLWAGPCSPLLGSPATSGRDPGSAAARLQGPGLRPHAGARDGGGRAGGSQTEARTHAYARAQAWGLGGAVQERDEGDRSPGGGVMRLPCCAPSSSSSGSRVPPP